MAGSPIRLAVVDDHRMLLTALGDWIRAADDGIEVAAEVSTWPALLAHPAFPVDVVLLDLDLRDELPVSVKLRALDTMGVRTVLMSTYSEPAVVRDALAAGALGYVAKSEPTETLVLAVRSAVEGEVHLSPRLRAQLGTPAGSPLLSPQERRIMALYSTGESAKRIASMLGITEQTTRSHLKRIRARHLAAGIDISTKFALRAQAIRGGLIVVDDHGGPQLPRDAGPLPG
ncbi:response regulator transcription factor [Herbiconiux moechotypicola]|uniref:Response regulator transcription factor n=1 Tax=Herbiconiux moechotypicola TaxID=637393 RepID=A0ABN3E5Y2_9MICO|nr:response regulator transcription factor [Herbiconiux moechotypicola]MCS5731832.1 response regulator transcription factor [Herbiconiux moechotypicola]